MVINSHENIGYSHSRIRYFPSHSYFRFRDSLQFCSALMEIPWELDYVSHEDLITMVISYFLVSSLTDVDGHSELTRTILQRS